MAPKTGISFYCAMPTAQGVCFIFQFSMLAVFTRPSTLAAFH